jgi:hypothetical protein
LIAAVVLFGWLFCFSSSFMALWRRALFFGSVDLWRLARCFGGAHGARFFGGGVVAAGLPRRP